MEPKLLIDDKSISCIEIKIKYLTIIFNDPFVEEEYFSDIIKNSGNSRYVNCSRVFLRVQT